jgi:citronellol/citronellal dehydrogenase
LTAEPTAEALAAHSLQDLSAVVTGAGSGIGRAIALRLQMLGAQVSGIGRHDVSLEQTAALGKPGSPSFTWHVCDVRKVEQVNETIAAIAEKDGIDLVVNNAGGQFYSPAAAISAGGWRSVIDLNLNSVWSVCQATFPALRASGGSVVNISLSGVERGGAGMAHSIAARAGVLGLTRTLALEWAVHGIRINCVAPGAVDTDALRNADPEVLGQLVAATPLGRVTAAAEVAELVAFLASPASTMITGPVIYLDGGAHLGPGLNMLPPSQR